MNRDDEVATLRSAIRGLLDLFSEPGESATDRYERVAERFYFETGFMRPGKSQPLEFQATDEQRATAYEKWIEKRLDAARKALR